MAKGFLDIVKRVQGDGDYAGDQHGGGAGQSGSGLPTGAPGEFMPYWKPEEPYLTLIERDPRRLRIALSHEWGDYRSTPHIAAELERAGRFLEGLGHHVDWALPDLDFRAAFAAQTTCYITNIAQNVARLSKLRGHATLPGAISLIAECARS